jgi:hypothetical protein
MTTSMVKRFEIRMALKDEVRDVEVRARKRRDGWEAQLYLLPRPKADPWLAREEKLGAPVLLHVDSEEAAIEEMMNHVKNYFRLEITNG